MEPTYTVSLAGVTMIVPQSRAMQAAEKLVQQFPNAGIPSIVRKVAAGEMDAEGKARSEEDRKALSNAGYQTKETVYDRGSRVNTVGVENAKLARQEFEQLPLTSAGVHALIRRVQGERRRDETKRAHDLRFGWTGDAENPDVLLLADRSITERGLRSLVTRLGIGGYEYLRNQCDVKLRAVNLQTQVSRDDLADIDMVLRTRENPTAPTGREVYAVVSPSYTPFDADKIGEEVLSVVGPDARGTVHYDGQRTRIEALFHTTVQPENFVAGEFFRAGIVIDSDDTGAGGYHVRGTVFQNLCLNLIILDQSWQSFGRGIHKGSAKSLQQKISLAIANAAASLEHFRQKWGYAAATNAIPEEGLELARELAMQRVFGGILERELVRLPGGRQEEKVERLMTAWEGDRSSARKSLPTSVASVVNAFTNVAHTSGLLDAWDADRVSADAAKLLLRTSPLPLAEAA